MFRRITAITASSCGAMATVVASLLSIAPRASAVTSSCPQALCVYQFSSNMSHASALISPNGLAFGVSNSFGDGSRVELRNFSVTRSTEQWQSGSVAGEIELGSTGLCLTGNAHNAYVRTCDGWSSQTWAVTTDISGNDTFTNAKGLSLFVPVATAYADVLTSTSSSALWTPHLAS